MKTNTDVNKLWITSPTDCGAAAYTVKKEFFTEGTVKNAVLNTSAMGIYVPFINGKRIGRNVLAPGWTSYNNRIQYQSYDITPYLEKENTLAITVGQGWAVGYIGHHHMNHIYADRASVVAWVEITYDNGKKAFFHTGTDWDVYTSEITFSEIYHGETVDKTANTNYMGKATPSEVRGKLIPQEGEFITEQERIAPVNIIKTPNGETVIDFGQNMTGYVEIKIKGPKGSRIVIHHAEVLDKDGNFYTENMRAARNENTYILSGGDDIFKPSFSFQGFRYIRLTEYPFEEINPSFFRAIAVHSEMKRTGSFRCGNEKINQLYHNIIWGQKSNFLDIPTDCPQRNERLGWTGDAQVFSRTAAINYDVEKFFRKWLSDMAVEQAENGAVYGVIPACTKERISAAWGDAICIIPWQLYLAYGNKDILAESFPAMKKWVDYIRSTGPEEYLWLGGIHYGDWLAMDAGGDSYVGATSNDLIASAFFAYSTELVIKAGEVLEEDTEEYRLLYQNIIKAFREYFMEDGMPKEELPHTEISDSFNREPSDTVRKGITQTALTLILYFGLCTEEERALLSEKLVSLIRENDNLMSTGFVGTPYILHVLSDNGYTDIAYRLLFEERNPSWLYSVCHGATTMWEHWNGIKEDGSFWSKNMNSFNHYAYGAVYDWIFGVAAGIKPVENAPGYKEITVSPHPHKDLGFCDASIESRSGFIRSYWYYKNDTVYYEFEIPEGVTAYLTLPSGYRETLNGGKYIFTDSQLSVNSR